MESLEAVRPFLSELKSSAPTPGGGAVAGLCGALAAAAAHMVGSLTVGKKTFAEVEGEVKDAMARLGVAGDRFLFLANEDARCFDAFMDAWRLPKKTDEEKAARKTAIQSCARAACEPPLQTVKQAGAMLPDIRLVAEKGNRNAVSDAGVAAILVSATARAAALNVKINLSSLSENDAAEVAAALEAELGPTLEKAAALERAIEESL